MAELFIQLPDGHTQVAELGQAPVVMGRDPACDIPLEDLSASRRHAVVRFENGAYLLEDLGSKNGTLVNNVPAGKVTLRHGDEILIGAIRAVFHDTESRPAPDGTTASVVVTNDLPTQKATTYETRDSALQLSQRRLEILYNINDRLTKLQGRDELLASAMDVCFEMLRFERGAIAVKKPERGPIDWPVVRHLRGAEGELTVSRTILGSALDRGERVIVNDTDTSRMDPTVSMVQHGIRSAMCVPLMSGEKILGVIYGDRISTGTTYTKADIDFLAGIARLVTIGLINAQLLAEQKLKLQLEAEIGLAREIQTGLFPASLPSGSGFSMAARNDPDRKVSGDYYDALQLEDGRVAFLIADVMGHGVAASLLMANLQAAVRVSLPNCDRLGELLDRWNRLINANTDGSQFITCLVGIVDPAARTLQLASAGHHLPIVVRPTGSAASLEMEPGYPLGVMEHTECTSREFKLEPGECALVCYTDGVTEAMDEQAEQFGTDRLAELLQDQTDLKPQHLVNSIRQAVTRHCGAASQGDDITIIAMHLDAGPEG